jgi:hypothetical protein
MLQRKHELEPPQPSSCLTVQPSPIVKRDRLQHPIRIVAFFLAPLILSLWFFGWVLSWVGERQEQKRKNTDEIIQGKSWS